MTFTVTYRAKDGALSEETVEAADRAACVTACKQRGIVPVSVREGRASARPRSGKSAASPSGRAGARPSRGAKLWGFAILAVVILSVVGGAWWYFGRSDDHIVPETQKAAIPRRVQPPQPVQKASRPKAKPPVATNAVEEVPPIQDYISRHRFRGDRSKLTKEGLEGVERREKFLQQLAKDEKLQFHMTNIPEQAEATFKNPTEQVMDWVFNATVGPDAPPPLPMISGYELDELPQILESMSEIKEGDDETVIARKKMVDAAKAELKDYMARGGDAREFLAFYHRQLEHYHDLWIDATSQAEEVCRTENPETARKFIEATNKELAKKGIAPIQVRKGLMKRIGLSTEEQNQ